MQRQHRAPRPDWQRIVAAQGMCFDEPARYADGSVRPYWDESVHYVFDMDEILSLEADVELLHSMCLEAVDHVVLTERFRDFALPEWSWEPVAASWRRSDPHVYGRFDLRYDGRALRHCWSTTPTPRRRCSRRRSCSGTGSRTSTPTTTSGTRCTRSWSSAGRRSGRGCPARKLTSPGRRPTRRGEDHVTVAYLQESAAEAGLDTVGLAIEDLGWDTALDRFVDLEEAPIAAVFKLYPWEWVLGDDFGKHVVRSLPETLWVEPLWKTLLSNKALLAVLWEMYPGHPNLLPAYLDHPACSPSTSASPASAARAPTSRSSAAGHRGRDRRRLRRRGLRLPALRPAARVRRLRPALGAWIVGDEAAGLGIRETVGLVTDDGAAFVPHRIKL